MEHLQENMNLDTLTNCPSDPLKEYRWSAIWRDTPNTPPPDATDRAMPASGGIVPGQTVHFVSISPTGMTCEDVTVEEVWSQANGVVSLRFSDDHVMHRIGYSADPLGNSWHYAGQCEGRGTTTEQLGSV